MFAATKTNQPELKLEEAETLGVKSLGIKLETYVKWKQDTEQQALDLETKLTQLENTFPNKDKITNTKKTLQQRVLYDARTRLKDLEKQMRNELYQAAHAAYYHEIPSSILPSFFSPQKLDKTYMNIISFNNAFDEIARIEGLGETATLEMIPIEEGKLSPGMRFTLCELLDHTKLKLSAPSYRALFPLSKINLDSTELKAKYANEMRVFFEETFPKQLKEAANIATLYENKLKAPPLPPRVPMRMATH